MLLLPFLWQRHTALLWNQSQIHKYCSFWNFLWLGNVAGDNLLLKYFVVATRLKIVLFFAVKTMLTSRMDWCFSHHNSSQHSKSPPQQPQCLDVWNILEEGIRVLLLRQGLFMMPEVCRKWLTLLRENLQITVKRNWNGLWDCMHSGENTGLTRLDVKMPFSGQI